MTVDKSRGEAWELTFFMDLLDSTNNLFKMTLPSLAPSLLQAVLPGWVALP